MLDMESETVLAKGLVERIAGEGTRLKYVRCADDATYDRQIEAKDHWESIRRVFSMLVSDGYGVISSLSDIDAVGHRVVHGGEKYLSSVIVDDTVIEDLARIGELAPLHNPAAVSGMKACREMLPGKPMAAVFDTAFHQTMPAESYIYPIPYKYYEQYGVRKYGFHGTSHKYVSQRAAEILKRDPGDLKIITCHLGNGASITAIRDGKVFDTTMGFTPLAGIAMGTRSGNLDPSVLFYIAEKEGFDISDLDRMVNTQSGILGMSGISSDFRDVKKAAAEGNERAILALSVYVHRIKLYIGAYIALLNGIDALVFTAGIGENDASMRSAVCRNLYNLGIVLDEEKNAVQESAAVISEPDSRVRVLYVPTNEELMIARDTVALIQH